MTPRKNTVNFQQTGATRTGLLLSLHAFWMNGLDGLNLGLVLVVRQLTNILLMEVLFVLVATPSYGRTP